VTDAVAAQDRRRSGTAIQRLRARALAAASWVASRLPESVGLRLADGVGELWYRAAPARAAQARRNLGRVVAVLDARGRGSALVRRAAGDPRALERLVRLAFRHDARYYLDVLRAPSLTPAIFDARVVVETPETVEATFAHGRPVSFVSGHLGPF
jgi:lauroyl/myristoyl acyltransferase